METKKDITSSDLRKALGTFATGVTIVTASSEDGDLAGLTVNSFTSVSLSPPLILWCLASTSESLGIFKSADHFAVNILASDQRELSNHFATRQREKFKGMDYAIGVGGAPLLKGCISSLECKTSKLYEEGDHWIIIGEVVALKTTVKEGLIFNQSHYGISLPLPSVKTHLDIPNELIHSDSDSYFSLLFEAICSYQENFEKHQSEIIESDYEARILVVLNHYDVSTIEHMGRIINIPNSEIHFIIQELISKGLVEVKSNSIENTLKLTQAGKVKSARLLQLLQEHDQRINQLLGNESYQQFRENLKKIINWNY